MVLSAVVPCPASRVLRFADGGRFRPTVAGGAIHSSVNFVWGRITSKPSLDQSLMCHLAVVVLSAVKFRISLNP